MIGIEMKLNIHVHYQMENPIQQGTFAYPELPALVSTYYIEIRDIFLG